MSALIGDAAHAAPPSQGSGAAMAMEDALFMSRLILKVETQDDVHAAFVGHPRNMRQIETAREAARITSFLQADVGNDVAKVNEQMTHRWDWIYYIDLEQHIKEAEEAVVKAKQK